MGYANFGRRKFALTQDLKLSHKDSSFFVFTVSNSPDCCLDDYYLYHDSDALRLASKRETPTSITASCACPRLEVVKNAPVRSHAVGGDPPLLGFTVLNLGCVLDPGFRVSGSQNLYIVISVCMYSVNVYV